jgi:hypothetical protein
LQFTFWEEVFYNHVNNGFPSESTEEGGYFVGFAANVGDLMTFQVLYKVSQKIIMQSNVCSVACSGCPNHRLSTDGEIDKEYYLSTTLPSRSFIQSSYDNQSASPSSATHSLPDFQPYDLIGCSFLDVPCKDGIQYWVRVTKAIADHCDTLD